MCKLGTTIGCDIEMQINIFGGNKILLEHKDTKIFLDFGMSFKIGKNLSQKYLLNCPKVFRKGLLTVFVS